MSRNRKLRILAWGTGLGGAIACAITVWVTVALGLYSDHVLFYAAFIASGVLGALIAARQPRNSIGWLMCVASIAATLFYLPIDYAYMALSIQPGSWPFGEIALWLGAWTWAPLLGLFMPLLTVRFPSGRVPRRWRIVDWLAITGTMTLAVSVALAPTEVLVRYLHVPVPLTALALRNPIGVTLPADVANLLANLGLTLMLIGYAVAVVSVVHRFRTEPDDKRVQLKWFAYAGVVVVAAQLYGATAMIFGWELGADAGVAVHLSTFALPLAIAIAILHDRLYDIDLLINRTLVYGGLTTILAASYYAGITLLQRLFMAVSGQRSDAAYVLTAFALVIGFTPVKDWLQGQVDRRIGKMNPTAVLNELSADVEAVVSVMDVERVARRLLDQAVSAFGARGGELHLQSNGASIPFYTRGSVGGEVSIEVPLRHEGRQVGRLLLGRRRGGATYTKGEREILQRSADGVAEAIALSERLGLTSLSKSRRRAAFAPPVGKAAANVSS